MLLYYSQLADVPSNGGDCYSSRTSNGLPKSCHRIMNFPCNLCITILPIDWRVRTPRCLLAMRWCMFFQPYSIISVKPGIYLRYFLAECLHSCMGFFLYGCQPGHSVKIFVTWF